jgi:TM2 domain-containing membrane protein YozV
MASAQPATVYCHQCGAALSANDRFCRQCGANFAPASSAVNASDKSRLVALLLCFFLGVLGLHRFYVGKIGTGILWLLTFGFVGIGVLVDLILIVAGEFKDKERRKVLRWES